MKKLLLLMALVSFTINAQTVLFEDDFESYDDFIIENIGEWTLVDLDGTPTYGSQDYDFANEQYVGSYIIYNPSTTTPPGTGTAIDPHGGDKGIYCFSARPADGPTNDDWLISPQLSIPAGAQLSFWVKTYTDQWGLERFNVKISTQTADVADFSVVDIDQDLDNGNSNSYQEAPNEWTEVTVDLASYADQDIYIAINCVSNDTFVFMVDDFKVSYDPSASITDLQAFGFTSYPNPVNDVLHMKANINIEKISIANILGQNVINITPNALRSDIDFSNLETGVYLAKVQIGNTTGTFKVVKR